MTTNQAKNTTKSCAENCASHQREDDGHICENANRVGNAVNQVVSPAIRTGSPNCKATQIPERAPFCIATKNTPVRIVLVRNLSRVQRIVNSLTAIAKTTMKPPINIAGGGAFHALEHLISNIKLALNTSGRKNNKNGFRRIDAAQTIASTPRKSHPLFGETTKTAHQSAIIVVTPSKSRIASCLGSRKCTISLVKLERQLACFNLTRLPLQSILRIHPTASSQCRSRSSF